MTRTLLGFVIVALVGVTACEDSTAPAPQLATEVNTIGVRSPWAATLTTTPGLARVVVDTAWRPASGWRYVLRATPGPMWTVEVNAKVAGGWGRATVRVYCADRMPTAAGNRPITAPLERRESSPALLTGECYADYRLFDDPFVAPFEERPWQDVESIDAYTGTLTIERVTADSLVGRVAFKGAWIDGPRRTQGTADSDVFARFAVPYPRATP